MNDTNIIEVFPLLTLLLIVLWARWYHFLPLQELLEAVRHLKDDLLGQKRVYSAETVRAREVEFIREQLPKRITGVWLLTVIGLCGALLWALLR